MSVRAIETQYQGYRFRSRLEARWAVFFDTLGIKWEYEPEGFETPDGNYLPDFRLHLADGPIWFEVKPDEQDSDPRWFHVSSATEMRLIVSHGIPSPDGDLVDDGHNGWLTLHEGEEGWDNYYTFCICPWCGGVGVEFEGRSERIKCCPDEIKMNKTRTYDESRIVKAYAAARGARWEFGEKGGRA